ncbi:MAG: hypothetical protein BHW64_00985 [Candidatus Melainabacteria bacterium LEY3_CP_29_8]|nr:MAG: hypothetical protein BHW64_00985 [Candidatus Melainabacteria bacterium LEY3_CP_29_8]
MIIKKKKKKADCNSQQNIDVHNSGNDNNQSNNKANKNTEKIHIEEKNEFSGINLDEIDFEQREERRRGDRRRGYRRIDERNLVSRAHEEANLIKKQARDDGYNEGINDAKNDLAEFKEALNVFYNAKDDAYNRLSEDILSISLNIAKKIIKSELQTNNEAIINMINEVLGEVSKDEHKITLIVSKRDLNQVKDRLSEIIKINNIEAKVNVIEDDEVQEGGVIVKTTSGIVDASITSQLKLVEEALQMI